MISKYPIFLMAMLFLMLSCNKSGSFSKNSVNNKVVGPKVIDHTNTGKKIKKYHIKASDNNKNFFGANMAYFLPHEKDLFKGWKVTITAKKSPVYVSPYHNKKFSSNLPQLDGVNKSILLKTPGTSLIITYVGGDYLSVVLNGEISYEEVLNPEEIQSIEDPVDIPPIDLISPPEEVAMTENLPTTITFNFENNTEGEVLCEISELSHIEIVSACVCGPTSCSVDIKGERNYEGEGGFKYTLSSGEEQTEPGLVTLTINSGNETPLTEEQILDPTTEDSPTTITLNYSDTELDKATECSVFDLVNLEIVNPCSCDENGICSVTVTGIENYSGEGSFKYNVTANDLTSNDTTLTIEVTSINDAPVTTDFLVNVSTEDTLASINLNYTDVEGDLADSCTLGDFQNISLVGSCSCVEGICSASLLPDPDFYGVATFTYSVTSGALISNSSTISVNVLPVDDAPEALNFSPTAFNEDSSSTITLSYTDKESNVANSCSVSNPQNMSFSNSCTCDQSGVCSINVAGSENYFGNASFEFQVTANGLVSNIGVASLTILPVEDLPIAFDISPDSTLEDIPTLITLNYSDADSDLATSCSLSNLNNLIISTPCSCSPSGVCSVGVQGTLNYVGVANFNYTVTTNEQISNSANASLQITPEDDAPVAQNFTSAAIDEDSQTTITLQYTDVEGNLATSCETSSPTGISVTDTCTCNPSGICIVGVSGNTNFNGTATLNFTVTAGGSTSNLGVASLTINPIDDPPEALDLDLLSVNEDTLLTATLHYIDRDNDKAASCSVSNLNGLSIINPCSCNSSGVCTVGVQGLTNYSGATSFQFTVTANDIESNLGTAQLILNSVDDAPIAENINPPSFDEDGSLSVQFIYSDAESHRAASCAISNLIGVSIVNNCSCDSEGVCSADFQGNLNFNGNASFDYTVTANTLESNSATVSFTINPVDDLPIANELATLDINEDAVTVVNLSYTDADNDEATSCSLSNLVKLNTIGDCSCSGGSCSVTVVPLASYSGPASFDYTVFTGVISSNTASANFNVLDVQDPPQAQDITPSSFDEDTSSIITLSYTDEENDTATHCELSNPSHVTESTPCSCDSSGTCTVGVTGDLNYSGSANFNYTVTTTNSQVSNSAVANLTINPIDDSPLAADVIPSNINDGEQLAVSLSYTDPDGDKATSCSVSNLVGVSEFVPCSCDPNGSCSVTVKGNTHFSGAASFDYLVTANSTNSNTASVNFNIVYVDDPPETFNITPDAFDEDIATEITLSYFDQDDDIATSCTISDLQSIREIVPCACDVSGVCTVTVRGTSNYYGPASFTYSVTTNSTVSNTSSASLTINPVDDPIPTEFNNFEALQIAFTDDGLLYSTSYNVISLPHDASMLDGWKVTIKAENGPVFVYPTHNTTVSANQPLIDGLKKFIILTTPGTIAEFIYEDGNFSAGIITGDKSYEIFKDDAPTNCPTGMIPVPGSYLLETNGFCVTQSYYSPSSSTPNTFFPAETTCQNLRLANGGGHGDILNLNQYQTILSKSLSYRAGEDLLLNSTERTTFFNQYPQYSAISRSSLTCEVNVNCNGYQSDGRIYVDSTNYIAQKTGCSREQLYRWVSGSKRNNGCRYFQIEAYEMLKPGEDLNYLIPSSCAHTSSPSTSVNLDIIAPAAGGINAIAYPVASDFHIGEKNPNCQFTKFNLFSPVFNQTTAISHYPNISSILTPTNSAEYVISHKTNIAKQFSISAKASSIGDPAYYRCAYIPGQFRCDLPSDSSAYDTSSCAASTGNLLTIDECNITCGPGSRSIPGVAISKACVGTATSDEGVFEFTGCYPQNPTKISSCQSASVSSIYSVDLISPSGTVIEDIPVFCEVNADGTKKIDLVKTFAIAKEDGTLSDYKDLFFITNNTSSIETDVLSNSAGTSGILVRNLGDNLTLNLADEFVTGFHIHQLSQAFDKVNLSYRMQGTLEGINSCTSGNWIPLSGPGYNGGTSSYLSPALPGYTSIQGTPTNGRDAPISVSNYSNTSVLPTNVLSFSGSGKGETTLVSQSCELDPLIPLVNGEPKPATFITELKIQDTTSKRCSIPTSIPEAFSGINCGSSENIDGYYFPSQCSTTCSEGYTDLGASIICDADEQDLKFVGCLGSNHLIDFSDPLIFSNFFDAQVYAGATFTTDAISPTTGSLAARCYLSSDPHKGCQQIYRYTLNLPISAEFDWEAPLTYNTGSYIGLAIYEGTPTRGSYYGDPTGGTNFGRIYWADSNGKFIAGQGSFSGLSIPANLPTKGKFKLEISATGAYTFTFSSPGYANIVRTGQLPAIPSNFKFEIYQTNYGTGRNFLIDNILVEETN